MEGKQPDRLGKYEISGVLGESKSARVYKALDPDRKQTVVLKVLPTALTENAERLERLDKDIAAIQGLDHPQVIRVFETGAAGDEHFIAMEYVPGTTLEKVLKDRRLSLAEAIRLFTAICGGLEAAHRRNVVHRNLSPRRVLVSDNLATVKVTDFGIGAVEGISEETGTLATSDVNMGSLHYMAPEQARNLSAADPRSDVYSAGVLLYEMLTGRVPVGRFTLPSQLNSEVPPEVDPLVLRCLEAQPKNRYPSISALLADTRKLADSLRLGLVHEVRGFSTSTSKILLKPTRSRVFRYGLLAAGVVISAGVLLYAITGLSSPEDASPEVPGPATTEAALESRQEAPAGEVPPPAEELALEPDKEESAGTPTAQIEPKRTEPAAVTATPSQSEPAAAQPQPAAPSRPTLAEDLRVAKNKLDARLFDEAQRDLERLIANNPKSAAIQEAYLLLGTAHERQRNPDRARAIYVELQSRFSTSDAVAESNLRVARLLRATKNRADLREARSVLSNLVSAYSGSSWAARALVERAEIEQQARWEVEDRTLGRKVPAALVSYRQLVSQYSNEPGVENALDQLGDMYLDLKEFARAAEAFETLGRRFPSTQSDAWWKAGQVYDRRLDQPAKAIAAYELVPRESKRHSDARRRIDKLSKR